MTKEKKFITCDGNQAAAHIRFYLQWDSKDSLQDIIDKINHFDKVHLSFDEANQMLIVE